MNLLNFQANLSYPLTHNSHPNLSLKKSLPFKPNSFRTKTLSSASLPKIPARDRIIDFGKHKGKMLGSLPSSYLKWVSKNLRARDFEEWAKLADQVLVDPVYQDRVEWEFADNVLNGNRSSSLGSINDNGAVSELLEISERFGWDNKDKEGWSMIKFELLGTSKGGRIPRVNTKNGGEDDRETTEKEVGVNLSEGCERRRERRERMRMKREEVVGNRIRRRDNDGIENKKSSDQIGSERVAEDNESFSNPKFPGREALLRKVLSRRRR